MTNHTRLSEPLTAQNAALVLIDHQVGLMTGVRDISTGELKHNVVGLAKAATLSKAACAPSTAATDRSKKRWPASVRARARVVR